MVDGLFVQKSKPDMDFHAQNTQQLKRSAPTTPQNMQNGHLDFSSEDPEQDYPSLHLAVIEENTPRVMDLIAGGFDVNLRDARGGTALHYASVVGNIDLVRQLKGFGANVNAKTEIGAIPLHFAAKQGHLQVVQALVDYGSHINVTYNTGQTPLHLASYYKHQQVVAFLIQKGADLLVQDNDGITALEIIQTHLGQSFLQQAAQQVLNEYQQKGGIDKQSKDVQMTLNNLKKYMDGQNIAQQS